MDWVPLGTWSYLYLSFTNTAAFSPTSDVMPLKRWAKMIMMLRAGISLLLALMVCVGRRRAARLIVECAQAARAMLTTLLRPVFLAW